MSDVQPGMHLHQYQNVHNTPLDSASVIYQRDVSDCLTADTASQAMMNASHFSTFNFPYSGIDGQSSMPPLADASNVELNSHQVDLFSQHASMNHGLASAPPSNVLTGVHATPAHAFGAAGSDPRRASVDTSDDDVLERSSPLSNQHEDAAQDDFTPSGQGRGDGTDLGVKVKNNRSLAPPAWSELKTKAGKDRKRLPLACIACRRKKIRCSGEKPACKHCMRSRIPCVYKVTTRKAAPRTDYMAMLDKRLKRMEERIIKLVPKTETVAPPIIRAVVKPSVLGMGGSSGNKPSSKKRNSDEAFGTDLEAWARSSKTKHSEDDVATSAANQDSGEEQLLQEGITTLPSKEIQEHLAEVFFDQVYGQTYQLLHKPSYMRKLRNDTLPPVLVLSVCAVAARFSTNPKLITGARQFMRGEEWASQARDICTRRYEWPNTTILTCLLILSLHEFGTCHGGRSWALGGQAIRMAFALQLHKDLDYDPQSPNKEIKLSFIDREIRRRIMWSCFLMDRFNSSGTDRPMFIKEESIKVPLPVIEKYFQFDMPARTEFLDGKAVEPMPHEDGYLSNPRHNMGVAAYTIRSVAHWGQIINYLNQGGKEQDLHPMWSEESEYARLLSNVELLLHSLPSAFQYNRQTLELHQTEGSVNHLIFLHLSIQQNILFLNQAAVSFSHEQIGLHAPDDFLDQASTNTFAAANRISDVLRDAEDLQCCISAPFAGYCAFSSTSVHVMGIFSGNPALKVTAEANSSVNLRFLQKMMKYWGMFHWMAERIRTQYRTALDASCSGVTTNGAKLSSPILQYSDWFNKYPLGLSDGDYMDPAMNKRKEKGADGVLEQKPELQSVGEFLTNLSPVNTSLSGKEGARAQPVKRKAVYKRQPIAPTKIHRRKSESSQPSSTGGRVDPAGTRAQHHREHDQRRFSTPLGCQTTSPSGYSPLAVPPSQAASYSVISPISPATSSQFSQPPTGQPVLLPADMIGISIHGQQPNGIVQPLARQVPFGHYAMEPDHINTSQTMNAGMGEWDGVARVAPPVDGHLLDRLEAKNGLMPSSHSLEQGQLTPESLQLFNGQETPQAWFMPFDIGPSEGNQAMALGANGSMASFGGVYSGSNGLAANQAGVYGT